MPYEVERLELSEDSTALLVHPRAETSLLSMTPREKWKYEYQKVRLAKRGIIIGELRGEIGNVYSVKVKL